MPNPRARGRRRLQQGKASARKEKGTSSRRASGAKAKALSGGDGDVKMLVDALKGVTGSLESTVGELSKLLTFKLNGNTLKTIIKSPLSFN